MALLESGEMYLETIYVLSQESDSVRGIDIADHLGYSKPSVSRAVGLLKDEGLVKKDSDGYFKLTEAGTIMAKRIYERHTVLTTLASPPTVNPRSSRCFLTSGLPPIFLMI